MAAAHRGTNAGPPTQIYRELRFRERTIDAEVREAAGDAATAPARGFP